METEDHSEKPVRIYKTTMHHVPFVETPHVTKIGYSSNSKNKFFFAIEKQYLFCKVRKIYVCCLDEFKALTG